VPAARSSVPAARFEARRVVGVRRLGAVILRAEPDRVDRVFADSAVGPGHDSLVAVIDLVRATLTISMPLLPASLKIDHGELGRLAGLRGDALSYRTRSALLSRYRLTLARAGAVGLVFHRRSRIRRLLLRWSSGWIPSLRGSIHAIVCPASTPGRHIGHQRDPDAVRKHRRPTLCPVHADRSSPRGLGIPRPCRGRAALGEERLSDPREDLARKPAPRSRIASSMRSARPDQIITAESAATRPCGRW